MNSVSSGSRCIVGISVVTAATLRRQRRSFLRRRSGRGIWACIGNGCGIVHDAKGRRRAISVKLMRSRAESLIPIHHGRRIGVPSRSWHCVLTRLVQRMANALLPMRTITSSSSCMFCPTLMVAQSARRWAPVVVQRTIRCIGGLRSAADNVFD